MKCITYYYCIIVAFIVNSIVSHNSFRSDNLSTSLDLYGDEILFTDEHWFNKMFHPSKHAVLGPLLVLVHGIKYEGEGGFHWTISHNITIYSYEIVRSGELISMDDLYNSLVEHYFLNRQDSLSKVESTLDFISTLYDHILDLGFHDKLSAEINVDELILLADKVTSEMTKHHATQTIPTDYNPFGGITIHSKSGSSDVVNVPDSRENCFGGFSNLDTFIFFVAYHDSISFQTLDRLFSADGGVDSMSSIVPVHIESTVFFEYTLFRDYFTSDVMSELHTSAVRFVGITSYKTLSLYDSCCSASVAKYLAVAPRLDMDVVPLIRSKRGLMKRAVLSHGPPFRVAWDALLQEMGYSLETIRILDDISPFYRNSMIITPQWLERLSIKMRRATDITTHNDTIRALFAVSAGKYRDVLASQAEMESDSSAVAMRIFGTPYYQLFPFVFERLPAFFLGADGARVCQHIDECYYNTHS